MTMLLAVGEEYPIKVPEVSGGGLLEVLEDGSLILTLFMPNPSVEEMAAIHEGFTSYALYVSPDPPYAGVWVWKFPAPVGYLESPFHAGIYPAERMNGFLRKLPEENNALTVVTLDGKIISHLRMTGLMHGAMRAFHDLVWKQLVESPITQGEYGAELKKVYRHTSKELYQRGTSWKHREEQNK